MADGGRTKRRLPSGSACNSCRKKKNRCDGERPQCGCCRSRGTPCDYSSVFASQLSVEELQKFMVAKMNSESHHYERSQRGADKRQQIQCPSPESNRVTVTLGTTADLPSNSEHHSRDAVHIENTRSQVHGRAAVNEPVDVEEGGSDSLVAQSSSESPQPEGYFGESSTFSFVSSCLPETSCQCEQRHSPKRRRHSVLSSTLTYPLRQDSAVLSEEHDSSISFPERNLADSLLDAYFNRVRPLYPFLHEPSFRAEYERVWLLPRQSRTKLRPEWLGILNLIFAYGCEFCNAIPKDDVPAKAAEFVARSRGLIFSQIFRSGTLEMVQALLLLSHYLQGTLEVEQCWNLVGLMIRTAVGIGLHLNSSNRGMTAIEVEFRKRAWWGCVVIDRTLSMKFGRPASIRPTNNFAVDLPLNVDDQYITNEAMIPRQPEGRPSLMNFYSQTIKASAIIAKILTDLYQPDCRGTENHGKSHFMPQDSDILRILGSTVCIDGEALLWWNEVPSHLTHEPEVADGIDFQRQREVLLIRFLNIRLLLHRQAFLIYSRREIEDTFQRAVAVASARSCITSASETIRLVSTHYSLGLLNSLAYNLHCEYSKLGYISVSGFELILKDVFTAMGVLLRLQTMDKTKLDAVGMDNQRDTLESGMKFLKEASSRSALAARYILMLQRLQRHDSAVLNSHESPSTFRNGDVSEPQFIFTDELNWLSAGQGDSEALRFQSEADFDSIYYNEFLQGRDLPHGFISGQWANAEYVF